MKYPLLTQILAANPRYATLEWDNELNSLLAQENALHNEVEAYINQFGDTEEKEKLKKLEEDFIESVNSTEGGGEMAAHTKVIDAIEDAFSLGYQLCQETNETDFVFVEDKNEGQYFLYTKAGAEEVKRKMKAWMSSVKGILSGSTIVKKIQKDKVKEEKRKKIGSK